ncbi:hypothetical protein TanjilG_03219 [Lupinus angustifolius]|uniref:Uncharacterized protein n=1 Tax=Lupinus angustifolius TaxID=3871 RepID=A0A4P1RDF0_LUPAN|nr:hypothetical protein TanjilG_03219 [Lupinus angustifolius]
MTESSSQIIVPGDEHMTKPRSYVTVLGNKQLTEPGNYMIVPDMEQMTEIAGNVTPMNEQIVLQDLEPCN